MILRVRENRRARGEQKGRRPEVGGDRKLGPSVHRVHQRFQVSRPCSPAFLPNDRGVFTPIPRRRPCRNSRRAERAAALSPSLSLSLSPAVINHLSPGRWISHFPPDFPATTLISPSKRGPPPRRPPSPFRIGARWKNEEVARQSTIGGGVAVRGEIPTSTQMRLGRAAKSPQSRRPPSPPLPVNQHLSVKSAARLFCPRDD